MLPWPTDNPTHKLFIYIYIYIYKAWHSQQIAQDADVKVIFGKKHKTDHYKYTYVYILSLATGCACLCACIRITRRVKARPQQAFVKLSIFAKIYGKKTAKMGHKSYTPINRMVLLYSAILQLAARWRHCFQRKQSPCLGFVKLPSRRRFQISRN